VNFRSIHFMTDVLRKLRLLECADRIIYVKDLVWNARANRIFMSAHRDFPCPASRLAFDAYGTTNRQHYYDSGAKCAAFVADVIKRNLLSDNIRVCEWGCGPARVIRHIRGALRHGNVELYGADYNAESIEWCSKHIAGVKFFQNEPQPPLPFESASFDCVYAISVFTHLSEAMHFAWIKELNRVLRPKGLLMITTHGNMASDRLLQHEKASYDAGRIVVRGGVTEGKKWYLAYHPSEFMRHRLLNEFEILSHSQLLDTTQDLWLARNQEVPQGQS